MPIAVYGETRDEQMIDELGLSLQDRVRVRSSTAEAGDWVVRRSSDVCSRNILALGGVSNAARDRTLRRRSTRDISMTRVLAWDLGSASPEI